MKVKLIGITKSLLPDRPSPEQLIEYAGRVCWRTELSPDDAGLDRFITALMKKAHLSVIEHASATFEITSVSRISSQQFTRHRFSSISQESQRYVGDGFEHITPPTIHDRIPALRLYDKCIKSALECYNNLRDMGVPKEDARFVLPNAMATRFVMTHNFSAWLHFCRVRCSKQAQWEIRDVAMSILQQLEEHAPSVFGELWSSVTRTEAAAQYAQGV